MTQALQLNHSIMVSESLWDSRVKRLVWLFNGIVLLLGLMSFVGILLDMPWLYDWDLRQPIMNYQVPLSLVGISVGYSLQLLSRALRKPVFRSVAMLCYSITLVFGLSEVAAYLVNPGITMEEFIKPTSSFEGNLSFQTALGITLAGTAGLSVSMLKPEKNWSIWLSQCLMLVLISLSVFGIAENIGDSPTFRYLIGIPASLGWFFFSLALFFYPYENLPLKTPFFSSGVIRLYTVMVCVFWLLIVAWQAIWTNAALGFSDFTEYHVQVSAVIDELLEVLFSASILGLSLHILSTMAHLNFMKNSLQEANHKLEVALESLGMLSSTLSHDLKTPIKIQMNTVEMLQKGQFGTNITDDAVQEMLTAMIESKRFEHELVLNLVDLLRYKMQQERFVPKRFEMKQLLSDIEKELTQLAQKKDQTLIVHSDWETEEIVADYFGMKRVLHNLVNNAIQHTGQGCRIEVSAQKRERDFLFQVKDNGPGIPPDIQKNLFNRFNRVSSSGLGLYITRQIIIRHGGEIWVDSQLGQGSTFSFTIPAQ